MTSGGSNDKAMSPEAARKFAVFEAKMKAEKVNEAAILAFRHSYAALSEGSSGTIGEDVISPAVGLPSLEKDLVGNVGDARALLDKTVVLKLNGGLGTGMGLDKAKSLLPVKGNDTFLDLIAKQVMHMRKEMGNVRFMVMNSFSTSEDTLDYLSKYPELVNDPGLELLQNKVPKVDAKTLDPISWPTNPGKEWCPSGHGDLYAALSGSGKLDSLLAEGMKYMFVSNSDNLGATLDLDILSYLASSNKPFLMEVCERTEADKKGGHLATHKSDGRLILRESAQCAAEDESSFQDIAKHRFFNTNNLWIRLDELKKIIDANGGLVPLAMIKNCKTVDPQDDSSPQVFQLETAMGAAIECFDNAGGVIVPRNRFAPVKKCNDLLLLKSDAYVVDPSGKMVLHKSRGGVAPIVNLDSKVYKLVQQLEACTSGGNSIPSLVECDRLEIKGEVYLSSRCIFRGSVKVTNSSSEPKILSGRVYKDESVDLSDKPGLGPLRPTSKATSPIAGQKPGTSGLRKPTKTFMEGSYLHNFVQSSFDALKSWGTDVSKGSLVIGGDGRYFNSEAIQIILKIAVANGVKRIWVGENGLLSTPAVSAIIRERGPIWQKAFGAFILTASHNPGGPNEDFGIKYNCENGGPAPESLTNAIYAQTQVITKYQVCEGLPDIDISSVGSKTISSPSGDASVTVDVISTSDVYASLLASVFDFSSIRNLVKQERFSMVYDSMHGVQGPYARAILCQKLGLPESCLLNATPKDDFGGGHADPNLTYAHDLVKKMGLNSKGAPLTSKKNINCCNPQPDEVPCFGAAADGDADRNMILGQRFFVTPSDSLAVIAAHADLIPYFSKQGGLKTVARSMPTSGAVDLVAKELNLNLYETPTGWKFFGNLMDSGPVLGGEDLGPVLCGEESFGTGSDHIREKDGMWAVLAWLTILTHYNANEEGSFVYVEDIVRRHWATYGRNYYTRYDYEGVDADAANKLMDTLRQQFSLSGTETGDGFKIGKADEFEYIDPVDGSISKNQGIRFIMEDGSRIIFRLSGTGSKGATIRMYIEKYEKAKVNLPPDEALAGLVKLGLTLSKLEAITGRDTPTVIT